MLILEPMYREKAKENQQLSQGRGQKALPNLANLIDTREELAASAGVSHGTLGKFKTIQEHGIDQLQDMARSGSISIIHCTKGSYIKFTLKQLPESDVRGLAGSYVRIESMR